MADNQDVFGNDSLFSEFNKVRPAADEILTKKYGDAGKSLLSRATDAWRKDGRRELVSESGHGKHTVFYSDDSGSDGEVETEEENSTDRINGENTNKEEEVDVKAEGSSSPSVIFLEKQLREFKRQNDLLRKQLRIINTER